MTDLSVFRDKEDPECWRVEDNDYDGDGSCTATIFAGQDAEKRARKYYNWLLSRGRRQPQPTTSSYEQRVSAFIRLLQWTLTVVRQAKRLSEANPTKRYRNERPETSDALAYLVECHYFAIAAQKLIEYKDWSLELGLFTNIDFGEIDSFCRQHIKDMRDMSEHMIDYCKRNGFFQKDGL
jgi:hypothetical protein